MLSQACHFIWSFGNAGSLEQATKVGLMPDMPLDKFTGMLCSSMPCCNLHACSCNPHFTWLSPALLAFRTQFLRSGQTHLIFLSACSHTLCVVLTLGALGDTQPI